jgi:diguanylate cyclase (GGDEF)-like protein
MTMPASNNSLQNVPWFSTYKDRRSHVVRHGYLLFIHADIILVKMSRNENSWQRFDSNEKRCRLKFPETGAPGDGLPGPDLGFASKRLSATTPLHPALHQRRVLHRNFSIPVLATLLLVCSFSAPCLPAEPRDRSQPPNPDSSELPTLTTAHQAHSLTTDEAARMYPVRLRAVVTYYDPFIDSRHVALFVSDSTGGIFISLSHTPRIPLKAGQLVELTGVSGAGDYAPIVNASEVNVIGDSTLPSVAPRATVTGMMEGEADGQWVEIEGVVHAVRMSGHNVYLDLALSDGVMTAITVREPGADYNRLVDARVKLRGNAAPIFNNQGQMTGSHIFFPGLADSAVVEEPAPANAFKQPVEEVRNLLRFTPNPSFHHRVHIRGTVTLLWPGRMLCIQDGSHGLCAQTDQTTALEPGDVVDVVGFPEIGQMTPTLTHANYQPAGSERPAPAFAVTAEQALQGDHDAELVQLEGQLVAQDSAATDPTIVLSSGKFVFSAVLPAQSSARLPAGWKQGTKIKLTGICSVQFAARETLGPGFSVPTSFRILLRSPSDVVVIERPSWWTPGHALLVLALALAGTVMVLAWVVALRRRVLQQTNLLREQAELLRESESRYRHMAQHDALTGLATRLVLQDRLSLVLEAAKRHRSGLTLLMLDLDKFKEINDTRGHHAGDEVLRVTANRLLDSVRKSDTVARVGGDEFVILLPESGDRLAAEIIAEKLVAALSVPIPFEKRVIHISVSIGVCISWAPELNSEDLMKVADAALYAAKEHGRNRFEIVATSTA